MNKMYVIRWKSKINGRAGRGTKLFEREEAERLVEELNSEYPDIQHEMMDSGEAGPPASRAPETPEPEEKTESLPKAQSPILSFQE